LKLATTNEAEIEDFLEGSFVRSFEDGETRRYEFDVTQCKVVSKNDFNGKPTKVLRYAVRDPESTVQTWKLWDVSRAHANVYRELKFGNKGKGWTVMEITREGLNNNTKYKPRGIR
jgi:hypothetical protein